MEALLWKEVGQHLAQIKMKFEMQNKTNIYLDKPDRMSDEFKHQFDKIYDNLARIQELNEAATTPGDSQNSQGNIAKLKEENQKLKRRYVHNCKKISEKLESVQDTIALIDLYLKQDSE